MKQFFYKLIIYSIYKMFNSAKYYTNNNRNRLNDVNFINTLYMEVQNKMPNPLNNVQKQTMKDILLNVNMAQFNSKSARETLQILRDYIVNNLNKFTCGEEEIDIHEMLRNEIDKPGDENTFTPPAITNIATTTQNFSKEVVSQLSNKVEITSLLGLSNIENLRSLVRTGEVKKTMYLIFDTRYRRLDLDGINNFRWNAINSNISSPGVVNYSGNLNNITSITFMATKLPYHPSADNIHKQITLSIDEFSSQSYIAHENRTFHCMFDAAIDGKWINLNPDLYNKGRFDFVRPIARLDTITIRFGSPLSNVTFYPDRLLGTVSEYGTLTTFTTDQEHETLTGDIVYITNFTTSRQIIHSGLSATINRSQGHIITSIDNDKFTIDINTTAIKSVGAGVLTVVNGSPTITGTGGTQFLSYFLVNDFIRINNESVVYSILSIESNTSLTLSTAYVLPLGQPTTNLPYQKDNSANVKPTIYFSSKRIFIPVKVEYIE